jgi:hypothetical protein
MRLHFYAALFGNRRFPFVTQYRLERPRQFRAGAFEFFAVRQRQSEEDGASRGRETNPDFTFVFRAGIPRNGPGGFEPVHQFDSAVVLNEEPRGQFANRGPGVARQSMHGEQQLMLLRFDAEFFRGRFAEVKELADLAAVFGQILILV